MSLKKGARQLPWVCREQPALISLGRCPLAVSWGPQRNGGGGDRVGALQRCISSSRGLWGKPDWGLAA